MMAIPVELPEARKPRSRHLRRICIVGDDGDEREYSAARRAYQPAEGERVDRSHSGNVFRLRSDGWRPGEGAAANHRCVRTAPICAQRGWRRSQRATGEARLNVRVRGRVGEGVIRAVPQVVGIGELQIKRCQNKDLPELQQVIQEDLGAG